MADYNQARDAPAAKSGGSENKRSEVNELRQLLRSMEVQRDPKRYREVVEKVILYMTLGIDVSRLFSEMVLASATQNLVQKKLVYLYLCNYAESHSELTLLTVNTLQKDCRDGNPMIRGLALRAMCNLRVPNLIEYVMAPLKDCLSDRSHYVRKTAVIGAVKLFYLDATAVRDHNVPDTLYSMLQDRDPQVVANCVTALEEILAEEGGIILTREIAYTLLNRLKDFSDWNQCVVMSVLVRYSPSDEDEVFDILNLLDERLKHSNSGVVLAAARLFLHLTRDMPDMADDIYERLKVPLITFMSSSSSEIAFAVIHHIHLLLRRKPHLFVNEYKAFFCRISDPSYVKFKKLEMLTDVADPSNMESIVEELAAYVTDIDVEIAQRSVRSVGQIACKLPDAREHCISVLLAFLELHINYVTSEALTVMRDVLRMAPEEGEALVPQIFELIELESVETAPDARAALVWFLGDYGHVLDDAPYILEPMIDAVESEVSPTVRLQLLTSTVKLFFKRPPEMQKMMGRLFESVISEEMHTDVHDRALLYYRLITTNLEEAKHVICTPPPIVAAFTEFGEMDDTQLFKEFNSLSVIYGQPSTTFIAQHAPYNMVGQLTGGARHGERDVGGVEEGDLIDTNSAPFKANPSLALVPKPSLQPAEFESVWMSKEMSAIVKDVLKTVPTASTANDISKALSAAGIALMASSPPQNNAIKFFFYGQEANTGAYHLIEATLELGSRTFTAMVKSTEAESAPIFATVLRQALASASLIDMDLL